MFSQWRRQYGCNSPFWNHAYFNSLLTSVICFTNSLDPDQAQYSDLAILFVGVYHLPSRCGIGHLYTISCFLSDIMDWNFYYRIKSRVARY